MPSEDETGRSQQEQPVNPAVQELLANIPEYDPRRRMLDEFQKKWTRTPPQETGQARCDNGPDSPHQQVPPRGED